MGFFSFFNSIILNLILDQLNLDSISGMLLWLALLFECYFLVFEVPCNSVRIIVVFIHVEEMERSYDF